jgi:hypothetical protein
MSASRSWVLPVYRHNGRYLEVSSDNRLPISHNVEILKHFYPFRTSTTNRNIISGRDIDQPSFSGIQSYAVIYLDLYVAGAGVSNRNVVVQAKGLFFDENGNLVFTRNMPVSPSSVLVGTGGLYRFEIGNLMNVGSEGYEHYFTDVAILLSADAEFDVYLRVVGALG